MESLIIELLVAENPNTLEPKPTVRESPTQKISLYFAVCVCVVSALLIVVPTEAVDSSVVTDNINNTQAPITATISTTIITTPTKPRPIRNCITMNTPRINFNSIFKAINVILVIFLAILAAIFTAFALKSFLSAESEESSFLYSLFDKVLLSEDITDSIFFLIAAFNGIVAMKNTIGSKNPRTNVILPPQLFLSASLTLIYRFRFRTARS